LSTDDDAQPDDEKGAAAKPGTTDLVTELPEGMEKLAEGQWSEATNPGTKTRDPLRLAPAWKRWAFAIVPVVGIVEIGLHVQQTHSVVPKKDFADAAASIQKELKPDDLVLFAPKWVDAVGREEAGWDIMTMARSARPDESRFARAFELGIRGSHRPEMASWQKTEERQVGGVTITVFTNPAPVVIKDDLVRHLSPDQSTTAYRVDLGSGVEMPCAYNVGPTQSGGTYYPFGPPTPGARWNCQGTFAGVSIIQDMDHDPRQCILTPTMGPGSAMRIKFANVTFGNVIHGHHSLHYDTERHATGEIVSLVFKSGDKNIGRAEHRVGTGWSGFEMPTSELAGQRGELTVDVMSRSQLRQYCFEADTR